MDEFDQDIMLFLILFGLSPIVVGFISAKLANKPWNRRGEIGLLTGFLISLAIMYWQMGLGNVACLAGLVLLYLIMGGLGIVLYERRARYRDKQPTL